MLEDLIREIKRLQRGVKINIPISSDKEGYSERECTSDSCRFRFKVFSEDWENLFKDEAVFCPLCGHEASSDHFWTEEQNKHARKQAEAYIHKRINGSIRRSVDRFNRQQPRSGFIRMSMEYKGSRGHSMIVPIPPGKRFDLKIKCEKCGARFAVIGSAFFCPCCGHNSVIKTFDDAVKKIRLKIDCIDDISDFFEKQGKRDDAQVLCRSLVETSLVDSVVAIQHLAKQLYERISGAPKAAFNAFQRVEEGSNTWERAIGKGYNSWLNSEEIKELDVFFQKRHLLQHSDGIVDQKYLNKTGDKDYKVGQRIVVNPKEVLKLVAIIEKLAHSMREEVGSL